jgi:hypothetical protein
MEGRSVKIHFVVDVKRKEVIAMDVSSITVDDDMHDSKTLPTIIMDVSRYRLIITEAYVDGAYDSKVYRLENGYKTYHQA